MKILFLSLTLLLFFSGCYKNSTKKSGYLMGQKIINYDRASENQKDRENKIELSKIDSKTKIEIAKIESENKLKIARVDADTKKEVVHTKSKAEIEKSKIDAVTKKNEIKTSFYIKIAIVIVILLAIILFFWHGKKNRDLQLKLQKEKLEHEKMLKEKEFEEQKITKLLELIGDGKLPQNLEEEVILKIAQPKNILIESKD